MEILKQCTGKPLHAIFVCCGGGGMLAGVAAYVKRVRPGVLVRFAEIRRDSPRFAERAAGRAGESAEVAGRGEWRGA